MSENSENMALDALLAAAANSTPQLDRKAIKDAYSIEKAYQFEDSRETPLKSLQKLAEDTIAGAIR